MKLPTSKLIVVAVGVFVLFAALIFKFYRVQVMEHENWVERAHRQHEGVVKEMFRRGTIWSQSGLRAHPDRPQALALDLPKFHLHADPKTLKEKGLVAENLRLLGIDAGDELEKKSRNRRLHMWLSRQEADRIRAWWIPFARAHKIAPNALFFVKDYQRAHPFGKLAGQVLHTVRDFKEEETQQGIPTGGVEAMFHTQLSGKLGKRWMYRSPRHSFGVGMVIEEPEDGEDLYLTINHIVQAIAEEEIERGVKNASAKGGWAIVMDPHTGEVWALAQYPFFEPDHYRDYFNDERESDTLIKAVTYAYEPGSVMKALNLAICLKGGADPEKKIDVRSGRFPGRAKPVKDLTPHKFLNAELAIQKSSNIYFGRLIEQLDHGWYTSQIKEVFGLGKKTGIELPGEAGGLMPEPGSNSWSGAAPWSLAMGYNLMVTSFQMLRAYAVLANDGHLVKPTLVKGEIKTEEVLDPEICQLVRRAMRHTTYKRNGDIPRYSEAGKTGTAEKVVGGEYSKTAHFCTFIGITPVLHPRFIVLVAIDEPSSSFRYGGLSAAPVFRRIGKRVHEYLGTPFEDDDWSGETEALRKIYEEWNN